LGVRTMARPGRPRPMRGLATNVLYYGDNPDILRRYLPDAAVHLVYLDPAPSHRCPAAGLR
jgi:hypothetical protein